MSTSSEQPKGQHIIDAAIRIAFLGLIVFWCFLIFRPFITVVAWSMIIAVTAYPLVQKMTNWFGGRKKLAIGVFIVVCIAAIVLPGIGVTGSIVDAGKDLTEGLDAGDLKVPPPDPSVAEWPLIGNSTFELWYDASRNLERVLVEHADQVKGVLGWLFRSLAGIGVDILLTLISLLIAGVLMSYADSAERASVAFFERIVGRDGQEFSDSSRDTIRSVVKGVVLVALIQSILAWIGFVFADVPAAGVWAVIVLLLAVMQLPPLVVILPLIVYVFSYASSGVAIAFAVWGVIVSISDSFLKPMFLGRGLKIPMLVILIGAIGGMILHGIIGLFIGAVVMALGYQLYLAWLNDWEVVE